MKAFQSREHILPFLPATFRDEFEDIVAF
ncbi:hypothetical protein SUNI508_13147 [Seiridium unicorne]|uniref:Maturase K n=1 Tax=Seiridium unicorne TaxID=138068 RepID=A0ABR2VEC4_9PEZI